MKTCTRCGEEKGDTDFTKKKGKVGSHCLECQRKYMKAHYEANKQYYKNKASKWTGELKDWFYKLKSTMKCERCPENHPACLDFHHKDPNQKLCEVSKLIQLGSSREVILEEIAKCSVLCSNCHRKLHHEE
jgi:hypothetical protein